MDDRLEVTSRVDAVGSEVESPRGAESSGEAGEANTIAHAIRSGDARGAIELSAREHGAALSRYCMTIIGVQADAAEQARETLLAAHTTLETWPQDVSFRAWLFGIARRQCAKHVEKQRRQGARLRVVGDGEGAAPSTEELVGATRRAARARSLLERVRPTEREALALRYVAQLSFAEVAVACGIEERVARERVSRALTALRHELGDKE